MAIMDSENKCHQILVELLESVNGKRNLYTFKGNLVVLIKMVGCLSEILGNLFYLSFEI